MAILTKRELIQALKRLGELAQEQGHHIELLVVGGAAMVLMYDARPATHDVDVVILLPPEARTARMLAEQIWQEVMPYLVPGEELELSMRL